MADQLWLAQDTSPAEQHAFSDLKTMQQHPGQLINESGLSHLHKVPINDNYYYVKIYHHAGRHLRRYLGRSRVEAEWANQRFFSTIGVPTARVVAFAERRSKTYDKGIIVTEEVRGTRDLWTLAKQQPEIFSDWRWVNAVVDRLATHVRQLHDSGFIHYDLKWRNILVEFKQDPEVYIIDCPLGRKLWGPLFDRGVIKDLACLDRVARFYLSRSQRLRFYLRYAGKQRLGPAEKKQLGRILGFFKGR
jgi:tRNA A-37 threonylcarbamoyl transferase component Bud32